MTIRADVNPRFYIRFALIAVVGIGFSLWSLYDGAIKYPFQRERGLVFKQLLDEDRLDEWDAIAAEKGWPLTAPGEPKSEGDIMMQYVMAAVSGLVGITFLTVILRARGRWIEADADGLNSSWGEEVPFDSIISLNKRVWRSKGIAKVVYQAGRRKRKFIIDDLKFHREPTDEILVLLESKIDRDQIVGGPPEPLERAPDEAAPVAVAQSEQQDA